MKRFSKPFTKKKLEEIVGEKISDELAEIWKEFVDRRNSVSSKKVATDPMQERIFKRLFKKFKDPDKRYFSVMQSVECGWMTFYELKGDSLADFQERKAIENKSESKKEEANLEAIQAPRRKKIDIIREQAEAGVEVAKQLLYRMEHPDIKKEEDKKEKAKRDFDLMKKCEEDLRKRTFKQHTGGFMHT